MSFTEAISSVLSKYFTFGGRACRSEFWYWQVFNVLVAILIWVLAGVTGTGALLIIYYVGTFLPTLAVTIRRHHDGNRSGWWILIGIIPLIGPLVLLYWYSIKGDYGSNIYGPDPLSVDGDDDAGYKFH